MELTLPAFFKLKKKKTKTNHDDGALNALPCITLFTYFTPCKLQDIHYLPINNSIIPRNT